MERGLKAGIGAALDEGLGRDFLSGLCRGLSDFCGRGEGREDRAGQQEQSSANLRCTYKGMTRGRWQRHSGAGADRDGARANGDGDGRHEWTRPTQTAVNRLPDTIRAPGCDHLDRSTDTMPCFLEARSILWPSVAAAARFTPACGARAAAAAPCRRGLTSRP